MTREELITAATKIHNQEGCSCDPKYLMSCPRMAAAILSAGAQAKERSTDADAPRASER